MTSVIGTLPFYLCVANYSFSNPNLIVTGEGLFWLMKIYLLIIFNFWLVLIIVGTPLYLLLLKFNKANYLTTTIIGGAFTLCVGSFQFPWIFLSVSGFVIAPLFHYFHSRRVLINWIKI